MTGAVFEVGAVVRVQEVWLGQVWLHLEETVVHDDGQVLATVLRPGTPLTFPEHPGTTHPWARHSHWGGSIVLKLRRPGEWYAVWLFFGETGDFRHWYVNFERPFVRRDDGIDVDDLELDLVVRPDGSREWKDVEHLDERLAEGRFSVDDLRHVLAAASTVTRLLDDDERWWSPWDGWTP